MFYQQFVLSRYMRQLYPANAAGVQQAVYFYRESVWQVRRLLPGPQPIVQNVSRSTCPRFAVRLMRPPIQLGTMLFLLLLLRTSTVISFTCTSSTLRPARVKHHRVPAADKPFFNMPDIAAGHKFHLQHGIAYNGANA
jgi:hypothetical protein